MYEDRIRFIEHKGKRIFYMDFSNLKPEQAAQMLAEVDAVIKKEPLGSVLGCGNFENMHFSVSAISAFNKYVPEHQKYLKANTMVGITGLTKVMFDAVSKFLKSDFKLCKTRDEAFDWLVSR